MTRRIVLALIGLAFMSGPAAHAGHPRPQPKSTPAPVVTLSEQDKQHLLYDTFTIVGTVREIPEPARARLLGSSALTLSGMADSGQPFQATDVVGPKPAPFYRLVFSAASQGYCLVYYEHGGIAHSHKVDFFRLSGGRADHIWGADLTGVNSPLTLAQLRTEIRLGRYDTVHRF